MSEKLCYHCRKPINDENYLGNKDIGFIHLGCLSSHINKNKYLSEKKEAGFQFLNTTWNFGEQMSKN